LGRTAKRLVFWSVLRIFVVDPRQRGKVIYPLEEVLLLCLLAVLAGAETFRRYRGGSAREDRSFFAVPAVP